MIKTNHIVYLVLDCGINMVAMVTTKKNIAINVVKQYQQLIIPPGVAVAIGGTRK